jgi:hypothetical protein
MGTSTRRGTILVVLGKLVFGIVAFVVLAGTLIYNHPQHVQMRMASAVCPVVEKALLGDPRWDVKVSSSTSGHVRVYGKVRPDAAAELRRRAVVAAGNVPVSFLVSNDRDADATAVAEGTAGIAASASTSAR